MLKKSTKPLKTSEFNAEALDELRQVQEGIIEQRRTLNLITLQTATDGTTREKAMIHPTTAYAYGLAIGTLMKLVEETEQLESIRGGRAPRVVSERE